MSILISYKGDLNARSIRDTKRHFIKMKKGQSTGNILIIWIPNLFLKGNMRVRETDKPQT